MALDIVDQMFEGGLTPSTNTVNSILHASEDSYEYNLVCRVDSIFSFLVYYLLFGYKHLRLQVNNMYS